MKPKLKSRYDSLNLDALWKSFFIVNYSDGSRGYNQDFILSESVINYLVERFHEHPEGLWFRAVTFPALVSKLIERHPAIINAQYENTGKTLLHMALLEDSLDVVTILQQRGADVTIQDAEGALPIVYLPHCSFVPGEKIRTFARYLTRDGAEKEGINQAMLNALVLGIAPWVDTFVEKFNANVDACDNQGNTALMLAAQVMPRSCRDSVANKEVTISRKDICKYLLKKGAKIDAITNQGNLLHVAIRQGDIGLLDFLFRKYEHIMKEMLGVENEFGKTPLCVAAECYFLNALRILKAYGAQLIPTSTGMMPQECIVMPRWDEEEKRNYDEVVGYLNSWQEECGAASAVTVPQTSSLRLLGAGSAATEASASDGFTLSRPPSSGR